jgi:hypothetical protein
MLVAFHQLCSIALLNWVVQVNSQAEETLGRSADTESCLRSLMANLLIQGGRSKTAYSYGESCTGCHG